MIKITPLIERATFYKNLKSHLMIGCEDKCIVAIDCVPTFELISRARNCMIFVSFQSGGMDSLTFKSYFRTAIVHEVESYNCPFECNFKGKKLIEKINIG